VARRWWGGRSGEAAGTSVDCSSDFTGDGRADLVVGAPHAGVVREGRVYLLASPPPASGPLAEASTLLIEGTEPNARLGTALASGDFDGDGVHDLAIGAPGSFSGVGRALVYDGAHLASADPQLAPRTTFDLLGRAPGDHLGQALAAGHLNNDGIHDLAIGAPSWSLDDSHDAGRLFLWNGGTDWAATEIANEDDDRRIVGTRPYQRTGARMGLGDVDGDGNDDLVLATRDRAPP
jgi:hypothetical protein